LLQPVEGHAGRTHHQQRLATQAGRVAAQ
jgi:hypothetical protein